jgi:hypothetical protein
MLHSNSSTTLKNNNYTFTAIRATAHHGTPYNMVLTHYNRNGTEQTICVWCQINIFIAFFMNKYQLSSIIVHCAFTGLVRSLFVEKGARHRSGQYQIKAVTDTC